jgi:hypothetical protein
VKGEIKMYAIQTLERLEKVTATSKPWKKYVIAQSSQVKAHILKLRAMAEANESTRVAKIVNESADRFQSRLDAILARFD